LNKQNRDGNITWSWEGDTFALRGFNVAITPYGGNPNSESIAKARVEASSRSYTFENITINADGEYQGWVQAIYEGGDSAWQTTGKMTLPDDGTPTIVSSTDGDTIADETEQNAKEYFDSRYIKDEDELIHFDEHLTSTNGMAPDNDYTVTLRDDGKFKGGVAVEEATENLIANYFDTTFESYNEGDTVGFYNQTGSDVVVSKDMGYFSNKSIKSLGGTRFYRTKGLSKGDVVTFSAWVYSQDEKPYLKIEMKGGDYNWDNSIGTSHSGNGWEKLSVTFKKPLTSNSTCYFFCYHNYSSAPVYWDNFQLEKKQIPTSFTESTRDKGKLNYPINTDNKTINFYRKGVTSLVENTNEDFSKGELTDVEVVGDGVELLKPTFEDDFLNSNNWTGNFDIDNGYLRHTADNISAYTINNVIESGKKTINFKFMNNGHGSSQDQYHVSPIWNSDDDRLTFYMRTFKSGDYKIELLSLIGGASTSLFSDTKYNYYNMAGQWFNIKMFKDSSDIKVKIWIEGDSEPENWDWEVSAPEGVVDEGKFHSLARYTDVNGTGLDNIYIEQYKKSGTRQSPQLNLSDINNVTGSLIEWEGLSDFAIEFDGIDGQIETPSINIGTNKWSVETWVYPKQSNGYTHLFTSSATQSYFACKMGALNPYFHKSTHGSFNAVSNIGINEWSHLAFVYTGAEIKIYINGNLDVTHSVAGLDIPDTGFFIQGGHNEFTNAIHDDIRLWVGKAKTEFEIKKDMNTILSGTEDFLELYYKMDKVEASSVIDVTGKNDGSLIGGYSKVEGFKYNINIETSVDGGTSWDKCLNGEPIPNLPADPDTLDIRQVFNTTDTTITPTLSEIKAYIFTDSDDEYKMYTIKPDGTAYLNGNQINAVPNAVIDITEPGKLQFKPNNIYDELLIKDGDVTEEEINNWYELGTPFEDNEQKFNTSTPTNVTMIEVE